MSTGVSIDAFLSYNSDDRDAVEPVYEALRPYGFSLFFDTTRITAGDSISESVNDGLNRTLCFFGFFGQNGLGRWQADELAFAYNQSRDGNVRFVPVILPGSNPTTDLGIYGNTLYVDLRNTDHANTELDLNIVRAKLPELVEAVNKARARKGLTLVNTVLPNTTTVPTSPARPRANRVSLTPKLLPKLCDREDSCVKFSRAVRASDSLPQTFVFQSEPAQSPGSFVTRVRKYELPRCLRLEAENRVIDRIAISLPKAFLSTDDYLESLKICLEDRLDAMGRINAVNAPSLEALASEIGALGSIVIVQVRVTAATWAQEGEEKVRALLAFWKGFPKLPGDGRLLVLVLLELPGTEKEDIRKGMDSFLKSLPEKFGTSGTQYLLPRVDGADEEDFLFWADRDEVIRLFDEDVADGLRNDVRAIFESQTATTGLDQVPLEDAETQLEELVNRRLSNH